SAQIREILISESAWEEMTCLFAPSLNSTEKCRVFFYPSSKYVRLEIPLDCQGFQDEYDLCGCFNVYKTARRG
ncbi:hypothetical protein ELJ75_23455, partial [Klebsiella pneumoniae]|nr:hypothetical protein [Klebsiella pneumoniae]